ncbi:MAG: crossover junction endodeoxyribonuclease RuvC [Candidatus Methanoperedens sp.]|nr:crossover junction endodeoxyribonuclease RuvC [Candidatus Methanoperedens sp.]MCZ7358978.1 crossover junction endodeoxyribonuclease RuvC [Candidatus Methanoperedens sp.]HLB71858.1 crossover junction endodeoxyribonuclease RuvC [Candidatus Methanoperedens sp.]
MIVIGIDPGLATVGFGVIRKEGSSITPVSYGCIRTYPDKQKSERLSEIHAEISVLFEKYAPEALALEKLFFSKNVTNAMSVSEARGAILLAAQQKNIPVFEYTPNQVKQAITGSGKADKRQMQEMIRRLLKLEELPKPDDAADGLSIALCHINFRGLK